jgi:hypothetical protein
MVSTQFLAGLDQGLSVIGTFAHTPLQIGGSVNVVFWRGLVFRQKVEVLNSFH